MMELVVRSPLSLLYGRNVACRTTQLCPFLSSVPSLSAWMWAGVSSCFGRNRCSWSHDLVVSPHSQLRGGLTVNKNVGIIHHEKKSPNCVRWETFFSISLPQQIFDHMFCRATWWDKCRLCNIYSTSINPFRNMPERRMSCYEVYNDNSLRGTFWLYLYRAHIKIFIWYCCTHQK